LGADHRAGELAPGEVEFEMLITQVGSVSRFQRARRPGADHLFGRLSTLDRDRRDGLIDGRC
jgi:hypothetical protein